MTSGNFTLMGAAGVAGAHWCALYAAGVPLGALIVILGIALSQGRLAVGSIRALPGHMIKLSGR